MKHVSFQSSTNWFQCAFELSFFFLISDVTYYTVICYEDGKFPVINTMVLMCLCFIFFIITDVTYFTVIRYEEREFPVIDILVFVCL